MRRLTRNFDTFFSFIHFIYANVTKLTLTLLCIARLRTRAIKVTGDDEKN